MDINLIGPINTVSYGVVTFNFLKSLIALGHRVSLFPIQLQQNLLESHQNIIGPSLDNARKFNPQAPTIRIWHQNCMDLWAGNGPKIGFPIFELDTFTDLELHHLSIPDHLIVCSKWAKEVCLANGIDEENVSVVPLGVNNNIYKPNPNIPNWSETRFVIIGKWEIRKSMREVGIAFNKAFNPNDNVSLTLMCYNPFESAEENNKWAKMFLDSSMGKAGKVFVINPVPTSHDVASIILSHDCLIDYSKAEGWGLPALEALACGKHVIATNYSGHTEFLNEYNANLISINKLIPAHAMPWFYGQGSWAKLEKSQEDQLILHMRDIHTRKQGKNLGPNVEGIKTAEQFTWDNAAKTLIQVLQKP